MSESTGQTTSQTSNALNEAIDKLPKFILPSVRDLVPVITNMSEEELWALLETIEVDRYQAVSDKLMESMDLNQLATQKTRLSELTARMADKRVLIRDVSRQMFRAAVKHAITVALAAV